MLWCWSLCIQATPAYESTKTYYAAAAAAPAAAAAVYTVAETPYQACEYQQFTVHSSLTEIVDSQTLRTVWIKNSLIGKNCRE